ncbi:MAG: LysR family transcriptional regulator [Burkholderiaceae bacterium]|jgi:DNA-binding transcriptional LysR family regulator
MNLLASLRYLVALHEHRHFGRAAAACHITQPALSNALRALESEFGVTIVQRGRSFVGFTPEGERVLASARTMLRERELLAQDLSSQSDAPHGTLVIGAVPSAMPVAARFAALLQRRHPGIVPTLRSLSSTDIELGLDELTVDVALGYTDRAGMGAHPPPRRGERRVLAQYTERYYLVSRAPRARAAGLKIVEPMPWREAARRPLCLLTPEMHNRSIVDAAFARAGTPVQPVMQTNSIVTLALAVVEGDVCSVMPGAVLSAVRSYRELQAHPLVRPEIETPVGFMTLAQVRSSRALDAALAFAQQASWLRHVQRHSGSLADSGV